MIAENCVGNDDVELYVACECGRRYGRLSGCGDEPQEGSQDGRVGRGFISQDDFDDYIDDLQAKELPTMTPAWRGERG